MRYICPECGKLVKDKFVFGLLHFCEPRQERPNAALSRANDVIKRYQQQGIQALPGEFMDMLLTGITPEEKRRELSARAVAKGGEDG